MDINEKVATRILGWKRKYIPASAMPYTFELWVDADGVARMNPDRFTPAADIGQCFEYVIPAMAVRGFEFRLRISNRTVRADFYDGDNMYAVTLANPIKAAEAICQAALKARGQGDE